MGFTPKKIKNKKAFHVMSIEPPRRLVSFLLLLLFFLFFLPETIRITREFSSIWPFGFGLWLQ